MKNYLQMNSIDNFSCLFFWFFRNSRADARLNVWHLALLFAILALAAEQQRLKSIAVSRRMLMLLSHIHTIPTYHKYLKEIQDWGYIMYRPSFHPGVRSEVDILM